MKALRFSLGFALLLALVALGALVIWGLGHGLLGFVDTAPKEVSGAVIGAGGLLAGGFLVAWYQRRGAVAESLRAARNPMYSEFFDFFFDKVFVSDTDPEKATTEDVQRFFMQFTKKAISLSSDAFVREWSRYRRQLSAGQLQTTDWNAPNHMMLAFEKVLKTIRRDMGYRNRGLKPGEVLGMWINDVPVIDRKGAKPLAAPRPPAESASQ